MEKRDCMTAIPYAAPAMRVVQLCYDRSVLSNTEPIDGGDDPDLEW